MAIDVGTNSWIDVADATTYFAERIGASKYWPASLSEPDKEAALITAYRQINSISDYSFPDDATDNMKFAQCEQALMLVAFADEMFRRSALQSQGVAEAGIVKEKYNLDGEVKISDIAKSLLTGFETEAPFYTVQKERDEDA